MAKARRTTARRNARGQFVKGATAARRAPAKRRRVRRNPATKATARRTYSRTATMRRNPVRRRRATRRVARNPISSVNSIVNNMLKPAMTGAVGAIANDALFMYLPLPEQFKSPGLMRYASKAVTAVGLTWIASKVVSRKTATEMGVGALTCLTAEVARNFLVQNVPALAPAAMEGMGVYVPALGYYNAAQPIGQDPSQMGAYIPAGGSAVAGNGMAENGYAYS